MVPVRSHKAVRFPWRWIWEAPLLLATSFCLLGAGFTVGELARGIRTANRVHVNVAQAKALLAAEYASFVVALDPERLVAGQVIPVGGGFTCRVADVDPLQKLTLRVSDPRGTEYGFACELLQGGAPGAFGVPFGLGSLPTADGPELLRPPMALAPGDLPELAPAPDRSQVMPWGLLERAGDIALLRLASGTDLEDYTFARVQGDYLEPELPPSGVLRVKGHLWLDAASSAVHLRLHRNLTLVVEGNLYLGNSLFVSGPGRLVLVAHRAGRASYRDLDGNGRWSSVDELVAGDEAALQGCVEGAGTIWFGLPSGAHTQQLRVDAALVATGEIQVTAQKVVVRGPLLGAHGITGPPASEVHVTGEYLPDVHRERVPGFRVQGPPRPGPLVPVPVR